MKKLSYCLVMMLTISAFNISGCAHKSGPDLNPSLTGNSKPTSRLPSPGNYQRNVQMNAATMMAPGRP